MAIIKQSIRKALSIRKVAESCTVGARYKSIIKNRRLKIYESDGYSDLAIEDEVVVKSINPETSEAIVATDKGEELVVATESLMDSSVYNKVIEAETKNQFGEEIRMINNWFKDSDYADGTSYWWNGKKLKIQDEDEKEIESFTREQLVKEIEGFPSSVSVNEGKEDGIELPKTNLRIVGLDYDINGNRVIKLSTPNGNAFSLQVLGNLPNTSNITSRLKFKEFKNVVTDKQLDDIKTEVVDYITKYGSTKQKSSMKVYEGFTADNFDAETGQYIIDYIKNNIKGVTDENHFEIYYNSSMGGTVTLDFNKDKLISKLDYHNARNKLGISIQRENNVWYFDTINSIKGVKFPSSKSANLDELLKKLVDWLNKNLPKYQNV